VQSDLEVSIDQPGLVEGKRVLIVEDGPTVTHGGMPYGAGWVAAQQYEIAEVVDPRPHAVGSIRATFDSNTHLETVLPAMGYSEQQREELAATIEASGAEVVLNASPADIESLLDLSLPVARVAYRWVPREGADIMARVRSLLDGE